MIKDEETLFCKRELFSEFEEKKHNIKEDIENLNEDLILNNNLIELTSKLYKNYKFSEIILKEEEITSDSFEKEINLRDYPRFSAYYDQRNSYYKKPCYCFNIPFIGNTEDLYKTPSNWSTYYPKAIVNSNKLTIYFIDVYSNTEEDKIKEELEKQLEDIKKWISWLNSDFNKYNTELKNEIELRLNDRKKQIIIRKDKAKKLGYPAEVKSQILNFVINMKKEFKDLKFNLETKDSEKILSLDVYESILKLINNMSRMIEKSPKSFINMEEEDLRNHFLVQLNGIFEGRASGETFNSNGKTDIIIKEGNDNIFIAECKFWKGKEVLNETIDQLLGYLTWRDTKTSIIIFNKNKDFSNVLGQIDGIMKSHSNFKSTISIKETEFKYKFKNKNDDNKEFYLTILVFNIPTEV